MSMFSCDTMVFLLVNQNQSHFTSSSSLHLEPYQPTHISNSSTCQSLNSNSLQGNKDVIDVCSEETTQSKKRSGDDDTNVIETKKKENEKKKKM